MFPGQTRALCGTVVEQESRRSFPQLGKGRHLPGGEQALEKPQLDAIETEGVTGAIGHRTSSEQQSIAPRPCCGSLARPP